MIKKFITLTIVLLGCILGFISGYSLSNPKVLENPIDKTQTENKETTDSFVMDKEKQAEFVLKEEELMTFYEKEMAKIEEKELSKEQKDKEVNEVMASFVEQLEKLQLEERMYVFREKLKVGDVSESKELKE